MAELKNTIIGGTAPIELPSGTTAQRPTNPPNGAIRFNTTLGHAEFYYRGFWGDLTTGMGMPVMRSLVSMVVSDEINSNTGSGNVWYDLSGNNTHWTLSNITRTTASIGGQTTNVIQTNAAGDSYALCDSNTYGVMDLRQTSTSESGFTVITVNRYSGGTRGRGLNGARNNWLLGLYSNGATHFYSEGWIYGGSGGGQVVNDENWRVHVGVGRPVPDFYGFYINGQRVAGGTDDRDTGGGEGPNGLIFGKYRITQNDQVTNGQVACIMAYDRALRPEEIKSTSAALMRKYNLSFERIYNQG